MFKSMSIPLSSKPHHPASRWEAHQNVQKMSGYLSANVRKDNENVRECYIGGWGGESNREIVSFRSCVRASEREISDSIVQLGLL